MADDSIALMKLVEKYADGDLFVSVRLTPQSAIVRRESSTPMR